MASVFTSLLRKRSDTVLQDVYRGRLRLSVIGRHLATSARMCSSESSIESHYAEVNGVRIHYEKTGSGDHTVLLLPGALGSSRTDFGPQLEKLNKKKYTIYAFDPRGYGKSIPPERDWPLLFLQRDAEDAVALMKSFQVPQYSVMGWSDGGITGLIIAGRYPQLLRRLIVWGANGYILESDMKLFRDIEDVNKWSERMREPFVKLYGMNYFQTQWSNWVNAYGRYFKDRDGDICREEVKKIRCPTLIVHGQKDALVVQEHPDYLHATIPGSQLVNWPEGKHNLHLRYADELNKLAEEFLDKDK
ncbi:hypothetical protein BaRGS_00002940 [Batillaria attramentaria]|uniref:AB hydrolase-1 domain-containing protein n=1 Tax=Batillaria attramentaria TaxID=370345 RepID=A0ABD0M183_9CAEN